MFLNSCFHRLWKTDLEVLEEPHVFFCLFFLGGGGVVFLFFCAKNISSLKIQFVIFILFYECLAVIHSRFTKCKLLWTFHDTILEIQPSHVSWPNLWSLLDLTFDLSFDLTFDLTYELTVNLTFDLSLHF